MRFVLNLTYIYHCRQDEYIIKYNKIKNRNYLWIVSKPRALLLIITIILCRNSFQVSAARFATVKQYITPALLIIQAIND